MVHTAIQQVTIPFCHSLFSGYIYGNLDFFLAPKEPICTDEGKWPCMFPYKNGNMTYNGCMQELQGDPRCPWSTSEDGSNPQSWKKCQADCPTTCPTVSGDKGCYFPFLHEGEWVRGCIPPTWHDALFNNSKPWCPTWVDRGVPHDIQDCSDRCRVVC